MSLGITWGALVAETTHALRDAGVESPDIETRWIVESVSGVGIHELDQRAIRQRAVAQVDTMVARRCAGEPLQYVLGSWSFRGLELFVDKRVLIPRPETEVTAQHAIDACRVLARRAPASAGPVTARSATKVLDLGTGSGAIALAIAAEVPETEVWGTDASDDALAVARANLAGAGSIATRVRVIAGSWFDALPSDLKESVHVLVSNPPYIAEDEVAALPAEVRDWEPYEALVSGPTGLEAIEHLIVHAPEWLSADPAGTLVIEIAPHQSEPATELARAHGFADVRVERDLSGRDRVLVGSRA